MTDNVNAGTVGKPRESRCDLHLACVVEPTKYDCAAKIFHVSVSPVLVCVTVKIESGKIRCLATLVCILELCDICVDLE